MKSIEYEDLIDQLGEVIEAENDPENMKSNKIMLYLLGQRIQLQALLDIIKEDHE